MHNTISNLIITATHHLLLSIGIYIILPYSLLYWLLTVSFSIYLIPLLMYGYKLYSYNMDNITNLVSLLYYRNQYNLTYLYSLIYHSNLIDLRSIANITKAIYYSCHWLYQLIYYGIRLWLVMVFIY